MGGFCSSPASASLPRPPLPQALTASPPQAGSLQQGAAGDNHTEGGGLVWSPAPQLPMSPSPGLARSWTEGLPLPPGQAFLGLPVSRVPPWPVWGTPVQQPGTLLSKAARLPKTLHRKGRLLGRGPAVTVHTQVTSEHLLSAIPPPTVLGMPHTPPRPAGSCPGEVAFPAAGTGTVGAYPTGEGPCGVRAQTGWPTRSWPGVGWGVGGCFIQEVWEGFPEEATFHLKFGSQGGASL